MNPVVIGYDQLAIALVFVLIAGAASIYLKLKLERDLLVGTVRTFAQLALLGLVLRWVFDVRSLWVVLALFAFSTFWAVHTILSRSQPKGMNLWATVYPPMLATYLAVTVLTTAVVVQVEPWWEPQYFVTLGGMIIGNSMNAIALSLERLVAEIRKRRNEVEQILAFGGSPAEATQEPLREAVRAGMIPSINSLMTVGLVAIPGMMTGQILAGQSPIQAVKYQIVVMLMVAGSTALGCALISMLLRHRFFNSKEQLKI